MAAPQPGPNDKPPEYSEIHGGGAPDPKAYGGQQAPYPGSYQAGAAPGAMTGQPVAYGYPAGAQPSYMTGTTVIQTTQPSVIVVGGCPACRSESKVHLDVDEDEEERGKWASPVEFVLSCLGYAVGLGNVWRFPYMCYSNGGGAFLIPYVIMLTFVGLPVFFIELIVGQYSGRGPMGVWEAAPLFRGVGAGMVMISFIGSINYNMIIAWALHYMFNCFRAVLPWDGCANSVNPYCYSKNEAEGCEKLNGSWYNQTCHNKTFMTDYELDWHRNLTKNKLYVSPSEEYYKEVLLDQSARIEDSGYVKWDLVVALAVAWVLCFLCLIKGIRSSGKVVYFTATFPYLVLVILLIRGATLDGAGRGIYFYLVPEFSKLANAKVWSDAAGQIFFSLSVGMGGLMTYSSYSKFHNNVYRDTMIVTIGNCLTSFFAGFVIFSIMGFMAKDLNREVSEVVESGFGLAFVAYPEVVTRLPISQLWAFLFFFMLLTLGLDSQFAGIECIQTALTDTFPRLRKHKILVCLGICVVMFILGLSQCTRAGVYWMEIMAYYSGGWALVLMGLMEGTIFPWVYGSKRLMDDVESMTGIKLYRHWWVCWTIITPLILIAIMVFTCIDFTPLSVGDYRLPDWAQGVGWLIALSCVGFIPIFAAWEYYKTFKNPDYDGFSAGQRFLKLMKPTPDWKPSNARSSNVQPVEAPPPSYDNAAFQMKNTHL